MTTQPITPLPLDVAELLHTLNRAKRSLADTLDLFRVVSLDVATLTENVERLEAQLKAAREARS